MDRKPKSVKIDATLDEVKITFDNRLPLVFTHENFAFLVTLLVGSREQIEARLETARSVPNN